MPEGRKESAGRRDTSMRDGGKALAAIGVVVDRLIKLGVELHTALFTREAVNRDGNERGKMKQ